MSALAATRAVSVSLWLRAPGFSAQAFAEQPSAWKRNHPPYHQPACLCSATTFPSNRSAPGAGREAQLLLHQENQEEKQGTRGKDTQKFRLHIEPGKKARLQLRFHLKLGTVKGAVQGRSPGSAARQSAPTTQQHSCARVQAAEIKTNPTESSTDPPSGLSCSWGFVQVKAPRHKPKNYSKG